MEKCSACGTENRPGRKFCSNCGAPLALLCPNCGSANEPGERFCGECGTTLATAPANGVQAPGAAPTSVGGTVDRGDRGDREAERRTISVLFADLVGSTAAAEGRDPEDTREALSTYFSLARDVIERYGGTVEKFIGDAVMAIWGAPVAHEDDAERATRAALDLVDEVGRLPSPDGKPALRLRAAVMRGEAAVTLRASGHGMVAGDLVNTAARLQSAAEPGTVLVDEATQQAASAAIAFETVGDKELRGKTLPVSAWRAERVVAGRGGSLREQALEPPFVGRDAEFALIKDLFHATSRERRLRCISITGQAGIGKSRLAWELEKYLDGLVETVLWHQGRSPAYGEGLTFWALGEMVRRRARILEEDDAGETRRKLRQTLDENLPDEEERKWCEPKLLTLLGAGGDSAVEPRELFAAWRLFFERLSDRATCVLVFEDLHWADSGLIDFIEHLMEWSRQKPILIVTLARPELLERRPTWGAGRRNFTSIHLEPIEAAAMRALLAGFVPGLPATAVRAIVARAEGVPLYAVETVRMLLAQGSLVADGERYRLTNPLADLAVPDSLQALIAARLDALPAPARALLQDGSVLGQSFGLSAIEAVSGKSQDEMRPILDGLVQSELLKVESDALSPERGQYQFLQGVVREVAYRTLARRDRRARHLAAARYFESLGDEELASALASHYLDAYRSSPEGDEAQAVAAQARVALRAAADRALRLNAPEQAVRLLEQALIVTPGEAEQAALRERAGEAALASGAWSQARELFESAAAWHASQGARTDEARIVARLASALVPLGMISEDVAKLEAAMTSIAGDPEGPITAMVTAALARALYLEGDADRALELADRAIALGERHDVLDALVDALVTKGSILQDVRPREGRATLSGAVELADAYGLPLVALRGRNNLSIALEDDDPVANERVVSEALAISERLGNRSGVWGMTLGLAWTYFVRGDWVAMDAARAKLDDVDLGPLPAIELLWLEDAVAAMRGDEEAMVGLRIKRKALLEGISNPQYIAGDRITTVVEAMFRGDYGVAYSEAVSAADVNTRNGAAAWQWAARIAILMGDPVKATAAIRAFESFPSKGRVVDAKKAELRAGLTALTGSAAEALAQYDESFRAWRELGMELDLAHAQFTSVMVLGTGSTEGRAAARESLAIHQRLGAAPWVALLERALEEGTNPSSRGASAPQNAHESDAPSAANANRRDSSDQPFLRGEVDEEWRDDRDQVGGHERVPFGSHAADFRGQCHSDGVRVGIVEIEQRPKEVVPHAEKREYRHHREGRRGERQDDVAIDRPMAGTIDSRGLIELARDGAHVLAQQEDEERVPEESRHGQRQVRIEPSQVKEDQELRDEQDGRRQQHRRKKEAEQHSAASETESRKRICDERVGDYGAGHIHQDQESRVQRVPQIGFVGIGENPHERVPVPVARREELGRSGEYRRVIGFESRGQHPANRKKDEEAQKRQEAVDERRVRQSPRRRQAAASAEYDRGRDGLRDAHSAGSVS